MPTFSKTKILDFLRDTAIMSLAASTNGTPLETILLFAVDDDFNFYFATRASSRKAIVIKRNPRVSLSVWALKKLLVQADGKAYEVTDPKEIDHALDLIETATSHLKDFWPPVIRYSGDDPYAVFKIKPLWMRALDLSQHHIRDHDTPFAQIKL